MICADGSVVFGSGAGLGRLPGRVSLGAGVGSAADKSSSRVCAPAVMPARFASLLIWTALRVIQYTKVMRIHVYHLKGYIRESD